MRKSKKEKKKKKSKTKESEKKKKEPNSEIHKTCRQHPLFHPCYPISIGDVPTQPGAQHISPGGSSAGGGTATASESDDEDSYSLNEAQERSNHDDDDNGLLVEAELVDEEAMRREALESTIQAQAEILYEYDDRDEHEKRRKKKGKTRSFPSLLFCIPPCCKKLSPTQQKVTKVVLALLVVLAVVVPTAVVLAGGDSGDGAVDTLVVPSAAPSAGPTLDAEAVPTVAPSSGGVVDNEEDDDGGAGANNDDTLIVPSTSPSTSPTTTDTTTAPPTQAPVVVDNDDGEDPVAGITVLPRLQSQPTHSSRCFGKRGILWKSRCYRGHLGGSRCVNYVLGSIHIWIGENNITTFRMELEEACCERATITTGTMLKEGYQQSLRKTSLPPIFVKKE